MWFFNLLTESVSDSSSGGGNGKLLLILLFGIAVVVGMSYLNLRSQKKRQQEMLQKLLKKLNSLVLFTLTTLLKVK